MFTVYLTISTLLFFSLTLTAFPSHALFLVTFWVQLVLLVYMWVWGHPLECGQPPARGHSPWKKLTILAQLPWNGNIPSARDEAPWACALATLEYWPVYFCTGLVHAATATVSSSCLVTSRRHCFTSQQSSWHSDSYSLPIFSPTMSSEPRKREGVIQMFCRGLDTPQSLKDPPRNLFVLDQLVQYVIMKTGTDMSMSIYL